MRVLQVATHGTKSVDNSASVVLLAANARRSYAGIYNATAVGLWIGLGVAAVIGTGIYIPAGGSFVIDEDGALWRGSINGIMASGGAVVIGTVDIQ